MRLILLFLFTISNVCLAQSDFENLYLATDRPYYFTGQEMKITFTLFKPFNYESLPPDEIVYVELRDGKGNSYSSNKVFSKAGTGSLSIDLKEDLKSDVYELIGYSNHMRNYGESNIFRRSVSIYNTNDELEITSNSKVSEKLEFFSEGGSLIDGVATRISYLHHGRCVTGKASIIANGTEIQQFEINRSHIGSIFFNPSASKSYSVKHSCDSDSSFTTYSFPKVKEFGVTLSVTEKADKYRLLVRTGGNSKSTLGSVKLSAYTYGLKIIESTYTLKKGGLIIEIEKSELPKGVVTFYLSDSYSVLGARSVYNGHGFTGPTISLNKDTFKSRELIDFKTSFSSNETLYRATVLPEELYKKSETDIQQWQLGLGIDGNFRINKNTIEDLMIIESSDKVSFPKTKDASRFYPREEYFYLRGTLTDTKPLPDSTNIYFFIPDVNIVYQTKVDSTGYFEFPVLFEFYEERNLPFYAYSGDHEFTDVKIISNDFNVSYKVHENELQWTKDHEQAKNLYLQKKRIQETFEFYKKEKVEIKKEALVFDINNFFTKVDAEYDLSEYISFPNMATVLKEIISDVMLRKRKGEQILRIFSDDLLRTYDQNPFIFINNVPTRNVQDLLAVDPAHVKSIKTISNYGRLSKIGPFGNGGVIIVNFKNEYKGSKFKSLNTSYKATGVSTVEEVDKSMQEVPLNIPDLRDVLMWKPFTSTENSVAEDSFKASDRIGKYRLVIEYINKEGQFGYATYPFEVTH